MKVRLTHIDGKLPNLALMRLARWHRERGDEVHFTKSLDRGLFEPRYDRVYGSTIFKFSVERTARLRRAFPEAIIGGTGAENAITIEDFAPDAIGPDYSDYPDFRPSLGFTQRGCRMNCKFCVVPGKEGKPSSVATIADIWRGEPHPRQLHLLDNDFFGQPREQWKKRVAEIRDGNFKVCFNQGLNVRLIDDEIAAELATVEYRDDGFERRRLYTAWDNLKDEPIFFRGVDRLERAGIPPTHLMAYMLVGFDKNETEERVHHRINRMTERGIRPYVMRFHHNSPFLNAIARWVNLGLYRDHPFNEYRHNARRQPRGQIDLPLSS